jgi:flagellar biosynthesis protein FlhF
MNVKRFTARTSREALALVKQAFGVDAVVMSTRPCPEGVEVLAMAPESLQQIERLRAPATSPTPAAPRKPVMERAASPEAARSLAPPEPGRGPASRSREAAQRIEPSLEQAAPTTVDEDVETLGMSTLSFQDFVRERMLKRRQVELAEKPAEPRPLPAAGHDNARARLGGAAIDAQRTSMREPPVLRETFEAAPMPPAVEPARAIAPVPAFAAQDGLNGGTRRHDDTDMLGELRSMRGLIEQRFGALAFMEKLQRQPRQAQLTQKLLDCGLSPSLTRKLVDSLPADADETAWSTSVLEHNLSTAEREPALEDAGGVYALIGSTGVGKTTSTAKLAAAFATRHGAAHLGLITLDAYRVGAHEQLRTYGRILGVPVHTAHDRASLEDLLELLSAKKMVLIDTAGMAQRDSRTRELLEMLSHRSIKRLLVVNAGAQGETIEDGLIAWCAAVCHGVILSKLDEAVKLAPALDAVIRHKLKVLAVANGQRVPEDWHRLSAAALVQRALRGGGTPAWRLDIGDVNLVFAGLPAAAALTHAPV